MSNDLFLDKNFKLVFEKLAMETKLSDDPQNWQKEIATELYKSCPFLADYAVNVLIDRVEAERGYAFGAAEVTNQSEIPADHQTMVRIPLVVKDRLLQPIDVMLDPASNTAMPLNERRVRQVLFETDTFELSGRKPTDPGMVDQLYPPLRTNTGFGNTMSGGAGEGMGKMAANKFAGELVESLESEDPTKKKGKEKDACGTCGMKKEACMCGEKTAGLGKNLMVGMGLLGATAGGAKAVKTMAKPAAHVAKAVAAPMGAASSQAAMLAREGVKLASLLEAIAPTIPAFEVTKLAEYIESDDGLSMAFTTNPVFEGLVNTIFDAPRTSLEKRAEALVDNIKPTVVQFEKLASGNFRVRWANRNAFMVKTAEVPAQEAAAMGGDQVSQMDAGETTTVSTEKAQKQSLTEEEIVKVSDYGVYRVQNADTGEDAVGHVIPVMDFEMQPLELFVWTDGTAYTCQDEIAGELVGMDTNLPPSQPQGNGCFYYINNEKIRCLLPMTIQNSSQDENGSASHMGTDLYGNQVQLTMSPGLQTIEMLDEGHYAIPAEMQWLALGEQAIHLVKEPEALHQIAQAQAQPSQVSVGSTGPDEFSMEGAPLAKVATEHKRFIKTAQAELLLTAMGLEQEKARELLKLAAKHQDAVASGLLPITPLANMHAEAMVKAAAALAEFPYQLRRNLIKEAAALEDSETADKILSMGFLNPENISTFANYLPELDAASKKLAEMLIAARLGMSQVNEGAVERGMKNLEEIIQGLRALQQKNLV